MSGKFEHPFLRVARSARVTVRMPEAKKPWCPKTVEVFAAKSGWIVPEQDTWKLHRIVPFAVPTSPELLYGLVPVEGKQELTRNLYTADEMARFLNNRDFVPAEVSITARVAVE